MDIANSINPNFKLPTMTRKPDSTDMQCPKQRRCGWFVLLSSWSLKRTVRIQRLRSKRESLNPTDVKGISPNSAYVTSFTTHLLKQRLIPTHHTPHPVPQQHTASPASPPTFSDQSSEAAELSSRQLDGHQITELDAVERKL
ncbi:unnamed protein product [Mesocestoides corti]|uniref:Uncharacterized protein n=1 Tax=Mesocestoides corti TaxID=53468 RepID=A0A0R3U8E9_MESCO|nr:unnamed protein product [Mesocestoides corti]